MASNGFSGDISILAVLQEQRGGLKVTRLPSVPSKPCCSTTHIEVFLKLCSKTTKEAEGKLFPLPAAPWGGLYSVALAVGLKAWEPPASLMPKASLPARSQETC